MTQLTQAIQSALTAGELSPGMRGRSDLEAYFQGAELLQNFHPLPTGGAVKRAGTEFLGEVSNSANLHRLIPWRRGRDAAYVLELGPLQMRIRRRSDGAYVEDGSGVIVLTTPWSGAALAGVTFFQSADIMVFGHLDQDQNWKVVRHFPDTDEWEIDDYDFRDGPFLPENTTDVTLTAAATTGAGVALTASDDVFDAGHLGALFALRPASISLGVNIWEQETEYAAAATVSFGGRVYSTAGGGTSGTYAPIHDEGTESDGGVDWTYVHDGLGVVRITAVANAQSATCTVLRTLPGTAATKYWSEGAFSDFRGWPAVGIIDDERVYAMGSYAQPDTAHAGRSFDYDAQGAGFRAETSFGVIANSDGFSATMADGEVHRIVAAAVFDSLLALTDGGVKKILGPSQYESVTANAKLARERSSVGTRAGARPVKAEDALLYVRPGGFGLQELAAGREKGRELTVRARHAYDSPFADIAATLYPDSEIWARRDDGGLWRLLYVPDDSVIAWSRTVLGGTDAGAPPAVESHCAIPGDDGRDELWLIVRRTVDGATVRTVERVTRPWSRASDRPDEQRYLDAHVRVDRWNAVPSRTMTLTLADPDNTQPGAAATVTAAGHTPFTAGDVGKELWLRRTHAPARDTDEPGPLRATVTAYNSSASVDVTLESSAMAALAGVALSEWAFADDAVTGLDHAEGETVYALADGEPMGPFTVSGGAIALERNAARVCAGYLYSARLVSLPLEPGSEIGSGRGRMQHVEELTLLLDNTIGGAAGMVGVAHKEAIAPRLTGDALGRPPDPRTGSVTVKPSARHERESRIELLHEQPTACTVLGIAAKVSVNA